MGNKKGAGRPLRVFSEFEIEQVEKLSAVLNKKQLADYFGVSRRSLLDIEERQPEVKDAYRRGQAKAIARIGTSLIQQALEGNIYAQKFYLTTQAGWTEKVEAQVEVDGRITLHLGDREINPDELGW